MNVDLGIWAKLRRVVLFLLMLAGALMVVVWYLPLIRENERMRKEVLRLEDRIGTERETNKQLRASIEMLQNDVKAIERLARERLGYAKPGEILVHFEPPATNQVTAEH